MYNNQQPNPGSWQEEEQRMTLPPKRGNGFSTASMTAGTLSLFFLVSGLSFPRTRHFIRPALPQRG